MFQEAHAGATSGHFAYKRTLEKLRQLTNWPGMPQDVEEWCRSCDMCAKRRSPGSQSQNRAPMHGTHCSNHSVACCKSSLAEHTCNEQKKNVSIQDGPTGTVGCHQVEPHHNRRKPYLNPVVGPPPPSGRTPQQLLFPVPGSETSGSETDSDTGPNEEPTPPLWTHAACGLQTTFEAILVYRRKTAGLRNRSV